MDGVMLGRHARDSPWFFSRVDSEIYGAVDPVARGLSPLDGRVRIVEHYAAYATEEQRSGRETSREMLLKPLNQIFDGMPAHKVAFATSIRSTPKAKRPEWFGDEICAVPPPFNMGKN
jgi:tRNA-dihydrouridine synthase